MRKATLATFMTFLIVMLPLAFATDISLTYDKNGNLISGDGFFRVYNSLNQLSKIYNGSDTSGNLLEEYVMHPVEERVLIKKVYNTDETLKETVYYVSEELVRVVNTSGTYDFTYIKHDGIRVAELKPDGTKQFTHSDHLGSTSLVTNEAGQGIDNVSYTPFGLILDGENVSRYDYEGKETSDVTGETDFNFRMYKSEWSKFSKPDSIIANPYNPQDLNRYAFENNNPYRYTDPTGHIIPILIGAGIGGGLGLLAYYATHEQPTTEGALSYFVAGAAGGALGVGLVPLFAAATGSSVAGASIAGGIGAGTSQIVTNLADEEKVTENLVESIFIGALTGGVAQKYFPLARTWLIKHPSSYFTTKTGGTFILNQVIEQGLVGQTYFQTNQQTGTLQRDYHNYMGSISSSRTTSYAKKYGFSEKDARRKLAKAAAYYAGKKN